MGDLNNLKNYLSIVFSAWLVVVFLYLSGQNESSTNKYNECEKNFVKTKEYVWR